MNKTPIKVIKRKVVEAMAKVKAQTASESGQREKEKSSSRRKIDVTVLSWISERRENRIEEIAAVQKAFGKGTLLGGT